MKTYMGVRVKLDMTVYSEDLTRWEVLNAFIQLAESRGWVIVDGNSTQLDGEGNEIDDVINDPAIDALQFELDCLKAGRQHQSGDRLNKTEAVITEIEAAIRHLLKLKGTTVQ